jgi:hypothetical protein
MCTAACAWHSRSTTSAAFDIIPLLPDTRHFVPDGVQKKNLLIEELRRYKSSGFT